MSELSTAERSFSASEAPDQVDRSYFGHFGPLGLVDCLAAIPDEIDYGIIVVNRDAAVQYRNRAAHRELLEHRALSVVHGVLRVHDPREAQSVDAAIRAAADRGIRRMLTLEGEHGPQSVAFVPIAPASATRPMRCNALVLVLLGKRGLCAPLSADVFARQHGLTNSETSVLSGLVQGHLPSAIARLHGVALSTVRTQMQSIRNKTGARRIQEIVARMASLPPLVTTLRN